MICSGDTHTHTGRESNNSTHTHTGGERESNNSTHTQGERESQQAGNEKEEEEEEREEKSERYKTRRKGGRGAIHEKEEKRGQTLFMPLMTTRPKTRSHEVVDTQMIRFLPTSFSENQNTCIQIIPTHPI